MLQDIRFATNLFFNQPGRSERFTWDFVERIAALKPFKIKCPNGWPVKLGASVDDMHVNEETNFNENEEVFELLGEDLDRRPSSFNGAHWGASDVKHLIAQDFLDNIVPCKERIAEIKEYFDELCAHQPEFNNFLFDEPRHRA